MRVSVLICTHRREKLLENCISALLENVLDLPDEIVIVDGGNGRAKNIVDKWQKKFPNIKFIPTHNINLAVSRNIGLPYCSGDIIALTDDDVKVEPSWINKIRKLHSKHSEAGAIGGKVKSIGKRLIDKVADLIVFPFPEKAMYLNTVAGANASYKREVIEKVGKFDEFLFRGEDVDYNWRILKTGYKIYYEPDLVVYHFNRSNWKGLFYQIYMYGRAYYLVRKKWTDMYCIYPHSLKNIKDIFKIAYFFIGIFLEPIFVLKKVKGIIKKFITYPILILLGIIWRFGMIISRFKFFNNVYSSETLCKY